VDERVRRGAGSLRAANSTQDHFQGAPTEAINATNVAIAPAARTEVCLKFFIVHTTLMALRL